MEKTVIILYICIYVKTPGRNSAKRMGRLTGIIGAVKTRVGAPPTDALVKRAHWTALTSAEFGKGTTILKRPRSTLVLTGGATIVWLQAKVTLTPRKVTNVELMLACATPVTFANVIWQLATEVVATRKTAMRSSEFGYAMMRELSV